MDIWSNPGIVLFTKTSSWIIVCKWCRHVQEPSAKDRGFESGIQLVEPFNYGGVAGHLITA